MSDTATLGTITGVQAIGCGHPVPAQFTDGRIDELPEANLFVFFRLEADDRVCEGIGEAFEPPSGSGSFPGSSWEFLEHVCRRLHGRTIELIDAPGALSTIDELMTEVARVARDHLEETARTDPFVGVQLALTTALRDALRGAMSEPVDDGLGVNGAPDGFHDVVLPVASRYLRCPEPLAPTMAGMGANQYPELKYLQPLGVNGTKGHLLERQALAYGLSTVRFSKGAFLAEDGTHEPLNFKWSRSPISSGVALALCTHKEATRARLAQFGVPVPTGRMFENGEFAAAREFADRLGYPVVCKPATGVRGIGVVAGIENSDELERAFAAYRSSRLGADDFIVEQHIDGGDYRIVVVDDEVVAAVLREPASVNGDGARNVAELILHKNAFRRRNPHLWGRPIKMDHEAHYRLERQGLSLTSVPDAGRRVRLASSCSLSQGGDSIDVLDEMHPSIKQAAVDAVTAIPGLRYCGVDFLLDDHRKPLHEQRAAGICELNAHAAIGNGEYPLFGTPRQVARELFRVCATHYGYDLPSEPAPRLNVHVEVRGRVTAVGYRAWLLHNARRFGVTGWVRNVTKRRTEAVLQGATNPVSALASLAILGPKGALPTSVRTDHVQEPVLQSFEVRE